MFVKRYLVPSEFAPADTWRLVEWCRQRGADEFTVDRLGSDPAVARSIWRLFEKNIEPFAVGEETRERMSGRTADDLRRPTQIWQLNQHTIEALQRALPGGLLEYEPHEPGWFEDPILYRNKQLMLGVLSHEAFAVLRLSEDEADELANAGFKSHDSLPRISDDL